MIKLKHIFMLGASLLCVSTAGAVDVNIPEAGGLSALMAGQEDVTSLTLTGTMDASDFDYINANLTELTTLDLSGVKIVAYEGDAVLLRRTAFDSWTLPDYALAGTKITSIKFPAMLRKIGDGALSNTPLTEIDLTSQSQLNVIGDAAFTGCKQLTSVALASRMTIGESTFADCPALTTVTFGGGEIPALAFKGCTALTSVNISGTLTGIGERAFSGCTSLTSFPFTASVASVGSGAFEGSGLTAVDLSAATALTEIGDWAFANCPALKSVIFAEGVETLGRGLFFEDAALTTFAVPAGVDEVPDYIFKGDVALDTTNLLHRSIVSIGDYALMDLTQVTSLTLPPSVAYLGDGAMAGMTSLESLHLDEHAMVPELGTDVWEGIDQSEVGLYVYETVAEAFEAADQWKEFKINIITGIDEVLNDPGATAARVSAWFAGTDLCLRADIDIDDVKIFDLSGRMLVSVSPSETEVTIDTAGMAGPVYLVRLVLSDNTPVVLKLTR